MINILLWNLDISFMGYSISANILITIILGISQGISLTKNAKNIYFYFALILLYGFLVSFLNFQTSIYIRVFSSSLLSIFILISLINFEKLIKYNLPIISKNDSFFIIIIIITSCIIEAFFKYKNGLQIDQISSGGIYREQSHAALSILPLFFYLFQITKGKEFKLTLSLILIFLIVSISTTFIVIFFLMLLFYYLNLIADKKFNLKNILILLSIIIIIFLFILSPISQNTIKRFNDSINIDENSNISSLVYINGWQLLFQNFKLSYGFGIGFNAMGFNKILDTNAMELLALYDFENLGLKDGSFFFSKLVSEFGILGVILWFKLFINTIKVNHSKNILLSDYNRIICFSFISIISIGGFVRSAGYFTGSGILCMFFILIVYSRTFKKNSTIESKNTHN